MIEISRAFDQSKIEGGKKAMYFLVDCRKAERHFETPVYIYHRDMESMGQLALINHVLEKINQALTELETAKVKP